MTTNKLDRALEIAIEAHKDQKRADGRPYIEHIYVVDRILKYWNSVAENNDNTLIVGRLHDVCEDHPKYLPIVNKEFGGEILSALMTLNNTNRNYYLDYLLEIKERYYHYLNTGDDIWAKWAFHVKGADMIANYYDTINFPGPNKHQMKHLKNKSEMAFYIMLEDKIWERPELISLKEGLI